MPGRSGLFDSGVGRTSTVRDANRSRQQFVLAERKIAPDQAARIPMILRHGTAPWAGRTAPGAPLLQRWVPVEAVPAPKRNYVYHFRFRR
jgi:hypothetical protein